MKEKRAGFSVSRADVNGFLRCVEDEKRLLSSSSGKSAPRIPAIAKKQMQSYITITPPLSVLRNPRAPEERILLLFFFRKRGESEKRAQHNIPRGKTGKETDEKTE